MNKYMIAVCQMDSGDDREKNLAQAGRLIDEAAMKGALLAALPETMNYIGREMRAHAEPIPGPTADFLCRKAKENGIWLVGGSITEKHAGGRTKNTLPLIDPNGNIRCRYSKLHMFDVEIENGPSYLESRDVMPGEEIVTADTELGHMGFAVCYDLRFCEMFRVMALRGAQIIFIPSNFTLHTGRDHWETLLRARAIENGVYIAAPNQIGKKAETTAYGRSMAIDPWGNVIARAGDRAGCILAEIDLDYIGQVRRQIPSIKNRREDIYRLETGCNPVASH